jgi:phosphoglucomutase
VDRGAGNDLLRSGMSASTDGIRRGAARRHHASHDYLQTLRERPGRVLDMEAIRDSHIRMGVDPLGGAGVHYWARIAEPTARSDGGQRRRSIRRFAS